MKPIINRILEKVLGFLMSFLVIVVLWQVASRYLNKFLVNNFEFQIPTGFYAFTDELAGFLLIWVALAGAAYATGKKQHLAIDLISGKFSDRGKAILNMIINSLIILFAFSVLVIGGSWLTYSRFYLGQVSASMEIPIGIIYLILPISGLLICFYAIDDLLTSKRVIKNLKN